LILDQKIIDEMAREFKFGRVKIYNQIDHQILLGRIKKISFADRKMIIDFFWLAEAESFSTDQGWKLIKKFRYYSAETTFYRAKRLNGSKMFLQSAEAADSVIVLYSKKLKNHQRQKPR
jgi:hypothetical protein